MPAIKLDPRRLDQIKAISVATDTTATALIAELVRSKIAAGVIPADIPGVTVAKSAKGIVIELGDGERHLLPSDGARRFAAAIRDVVNGDSPSVIFPNERVAVLRKGTGFRIAAPYPGEGVTFPGDLAVDLAGLIEEAAK